MTLVPLIEMAVLSLRNPKEGLRRVLDINVPRATLIPMIVLVIVVSVLLAFLTLWAAPVEIDAAMSVFPTPFSLAMILSGSMFIMIMGIYWIGRAFDGKGTMDEVLLTVIWLQAIMMLLQVVQIIATILLPPLADMLGLVAFAVMFWLLTNFITEVHGFQSPLKVFFMVIASMFGIVFGLTILLTLIGLSGGF
ncbi:MAG: YIP1 family protein [Pseudoruegeria sp.]